MNKFAKRIFIAMCPLLLYACSETDDSATTAASGFQNTTEKTNVEDTGLCSNADFFKDNTPGPNKSVIIQLANSNATAFSFISSISTLNADRLSINGNTAVVADYNAVSSTDSHLKIIGLDNFLEIGRLNNVNTVLNLNFAVDNTLYVDTVGQGLRQIGLADPGAPFQLRRIHTLSSTFESFVKGNTLFQASGSKGLEAWNIENDNLPKLLCRVVFEGERKLVVYRDTLPDGAAPVPGNDPMVSCDKPVPANPILGEEDKCIGTFPVTYQARAISIIDENTLLVAIRAGGVVVLDITNPASPTVRSRYRPKNTQIWDVAVAGSEAYLAIGREVHVLDIRNPDNLIPLIRINVPGFSQRVRVNDGYVTFTMGDTGVVLHNLSNSPETGYTLVPIPAGAIAEDAVFQSNAVYIAAGTQVLKLSN